MNENEPDSREEARPRPVIKRRWAIVRKTTGGVAVLAVASAIGLGAAADQQDTTPDAGSGDTQISAEA